MNKHIEQIKKGELALKNQNNSYEDIIKALRAVYPESLFLNAIFYKKAGTGFCGANETSLPYITIAEFLKSLEEFVLPEKWYVISTKENRDVLNKWRLERTTHYNSDDYFQLIGYILLSTPYDGSYYFAGSKRMFLERKDISEGHVEITFEQFKKYVLNMKEESKIQYATREQIKTIHEVACGTWQQKLVNKISEVNVFEDKVPFTEKEVKEMFEACITRNGVNQEEVVAKVFTLPKEEVIKEGTLCAFWDGTDHSWSLEKDSIGIRKYSVKRDNKHIDEVGSSWEYAKPLPEDLKNRIEAFIEELK